MCAEIVTGCRLILFLQSKRVTEVVELQCRLHVIVTSLTLPKGVTATNRKGSCIAWWMDEETHSWLIVFEETGEMVWVPMKEVRLQKNWSDERRYS
jgi:hypothetical protein